MIVLHCGSTNHKKVKLPEAFYPFIEYIKENFSEVYEFVDNAYKSINIEEIDE